MFAPQFLTDKTERVLDFGYCLLRMNITRSSNEKNHSLTPIPSLWKQRN